MMDSYIQIVTSLIFFSIKRIPFYQLENKKKKKCHSLNELKDNGRTLFVYKIMSSYKGDSFNKKTLF